MRNRFIAYIALVFCAAICFSQNNEAGVLLRQANEILFDDPAQAIKIADNLIQNQDFQCKAQASVLLAKGHFITGQYADAVGNIETAVSETKNNGSPELQFDALLLAAEIYNRLDLLRISDKYLRKASAVAGRNPALQKRLDAYKVFVASPTLDYQICSASNKTIARSEIPQYAFLSKGMPLQLTARAFQNAGLTDSAAAYFERNRKDIAKNDRGAYWKTLALIDYSDFYFSRKNYPAAVATLEQALPLEKAVGNPYLTKTIAEKLSVSLLALGDKARFDDFRKKAETAQNDLDTRITQATNLAFENLQREKTEKVEQARHFQSGIAIALGSVASSILLLWLVTRWIFKTKSRHLQDVISYLKLIKNIEAKKPAKPTAKNLSIPKETEELLLAKLERFEAGKKYLTKDFSLAQLAALFETNTKYLSEIINKYKQKNFNSYVNELRIRYVVE